MVKLEVAETVGSPDGGFSIILLGIISSLKKI
jgi:hypothetical protein